MRMQSSRLQVFATGAWAIDGECHNAIAIKTPQSGLKTVNSIKICDKVSANSNLKLSGLMMCEVSPVA